MHRDVIIQIPCGCDPPCPDGIHEEAYTAELIRIVDEENMVCYEVTEVYHHGHPVPDGEIFEKVTHACMYDLAQEQFNAWNQRDHARKRAAIENRKHGWQPYNKLRGNA